VVESVVPAEGSAPLRLLESRAEPVGEPLGEPLAEPVVTVAAAPAAAARRPDARVLVFDVETTGTDRKRDQVIELCMQRGLSGADHKIWRFRPTVSIHPRAQEVHGISMEELADCPSFATCADEIAAWFAGADVIVGYNLAFDVDMLQAEYERAGLRRLDLATKAVVDPFRLWQQCEPRKLQHAHQRFVGGGFEGAHSAVADVAATARVLHGMMNAFGLDELDWDGVARVCDPDRQKWVGPSRHVQWQGEVAVLAFGKHEGLPLHAVAAGEHDGYLRWVCERGDFPAHVSEICARALELAGDAAALHAWLGERFGAPPVAAPTAPALDPVRAPVMAGVPASAPPAAPLASGLAAVG
jgi:DNA polymerase-3 subunit epsilon